MDGVLLLRGLVLLFPIGLFVLPRIFSKTIDKDRAGKRRRLRLIGGFVGNALMPLHAIIHPHTKHLIVEQIKDHAENDQDTDPTDPEIHLQRQLRRIRNGENLDRLTILKR
jgi:hypothetical protein